eukprot:3836089-Rhodomonas_salina.1
MQAEEGRGREGGRAGGRRRVDVSRGSGGVPRAVGAGTDVAVGVRVRVCAEKHRVRTLSCV